MAPNVGLGTQGPVQRGWDLWLMSVVMVIVAGLFVAIRVWTTAARKRLGMDDYTIVASLFSSVLLTITEIEAVVNGYGRHAKELPHAQVVIALKWFFAAQVMYKVVITLNKVSILCLYYRMFSIETWFRYTSYCGIAFIVTSGVAYIVATIFQCTPVSGFWDRSTKPLYCINCEIFWKSYALLNIITDFAILALPISQVVKLRLPRMEKLGLTFIFALGAFVCVTSIVRTTTLALSAKDRDPTWGPLPATIWSVIEANSGIICACLPKLRRPLSAIFPCLVSTRYVSSLTHQSSIAYRLDSKKGPPVADVVERPWMAPAVGGGIGRTTWNVNDADKESEWAESGSEGRRVQSKDSTGRAFTTTTATNDPDPDHHPPVLIVRFGNATLAETLDHR